VLLAYSSTAHAEFDRVKIGVLTDLSGIYESGTGNGSVEAAKMAAEEFGGKINGKPIEVIAGDHQNKPDAADAAPNVRFRRQSGNGRRTLETDVKLK
jgi:ABC-type branched-subunit amino acid transport system substrate-binding protein